MVKWFLATSTGSKSEVIKQGSYWASLPNPPQFPYSLFSGLLILIALAVLQKALIQDLTEQHRFSNIKNEVTPFES